MVKFFFYIMAFLALSVTASATTVVEDSRSRFVLDDNVINSEAVGCTDELGNEVAGKRFFPENAAIGDDSDVPYRIYRVAVPAGSTPRVSLSVKKTRPLQGSFCNGGKLKFSPVVASVPYLRDGLWIVDVKVPLYEKSGASLKLRTQFRLTVDFVKTGSGSNPGKRAVSRVLNTGGASHFGISNNVYRRSLRRIGASDVSDVHFLAKFVVGDKNVATTSEDGLYAVDFKTIRTALMQNLRQDDLNGIPVEKLRLYGASPDTMATKVPGPDVIAPAHLFEIPIEVRDHSKGGSSPDGTFNDGDTIVFVGYGTSFWKFADSVYYHVTSPYSFYQHFQLGWTDTGKGLRLGDKISFSADGAKDIPLMRYMRAEKDVFLIDTYYGKQLDWEKTSGKEWFWFWHCRFDSTEQSNSELVKDFPHMKAMPGMETGGPSYLQVTFHPHRSVWDSAVDRENDQVTTYELSGKSIEERVDAIRFRFTLNNKDFSDADASIGTDGSFIFSGVPLDPSNNVYSLAMLPNSQQYDRFDGFTVAYRWTPVVDSTEWYLPGKISGKVRMPVPDGVSLVKFVDMVPVGVLAKSGKYAVDSVSAGEDVRYLAFREGAFRNEANRNLLEVVALPLMPSGVLSDISKINSKTEYLIISAPEFVAGAVELGKFRSEGDAVSKYATTVVNVDDIYRQYTGGALSPVAIRNYIAYAYSLCPDLRYVLLVGSGHYDYRGAVGKLGKNFMPPFELEDNVTEDFFAVLDSGEMIRYGHYDLDVAVGRLPVSTPYELSDYIEKAKDYEMVGRFDHSEWRKTVLLAADDAKNGTTIDRTLHTKSQEGISRAIDAMVTELDFRWNQKKVYLLNYEEDAAGQKKDATEDFLNILNQGALMTTYYGHGSKTDWASEGLLKPSYISRLSKNTKRYTILNSFACIVGRFDEGGARSLSEEFLLAPAAGSIISVAAARETFSSYNETFGTNFMFTLMRNDGIAVGDAFKMAKNQNSDEFTRLRFNNEHYVFIGEPVVQMVKADIDVSLDQKIDTLRALDKVKLSGTVSGIENGTIELSLRESRDTMRLYLGLSDIKDDTLNVVYDGALIYSEKVPITGGRYETEFVTPRKISFGDTAVELNAWAYSNDERSIGRLRKAGIKIYGFSAYADSLNDTEPPSIKIQNCFSVGSEASFADGETVKLQAPACLQVVVEDSTALDFREQPDEGISIELIGVENPSHPYPFLEQSSKKAVFRKSFTLENYPAGKYTFYVRALDVLGNASKKTLYLEITEDMKAGLADVFNVPNPVGKKGTTFYFKNLAVDRDPTVTIFIYNQHGRLVKVIKDAVSGITHWDGKDNHGRKLANGLYHYVVRSEVPASGNFKAKTWTKKQKLLISR